MREGENAQHGEDRDHRRTNDEHRAEQDRDRGAGRVVLCRAQVEEQGRDPQARAEHDPGRHVPCPGSPAPEKLHGPGPDDGEGDEAPKGVDPDEEGARTAGGAQVSQGVAREGLTADDREDTYDGGHERHGAAHDHRHPDRFAREEARARRCQSVPSSSPSPEPTGHDGVPALALGVMRLVLARHAPGCGREPGARRRAGRTGRSVRLRGRPPRSTRLRRVRPRRRRHGPSRATTGSSRAPR